MSLKNKDEYRAYQKAYREAHRDALRLYQEEYRKTHPKPCKEKVYKYSSSYRERLRAAVIAILGGKCAICGWTDIRALQVDHINGGGRKEERELGSNMAIYRKILTMENPFSEYQLLCANHNWIKRHENRECFPS